jgi:ABC-type Fe3+-hydroxamate transport system substrate-binding protein
MSAGNGHKKVIQFDRPPSRVVSLVPSLTESLFDLGLGSFVVGITDYCVHPADALGDLPRLGGPKNPRVADILALKPELVLANQEENTLPVVEALEARGVKVWVTFPKTVRQALDVLWTLTGLFMHRTAAIRLETLELTLEWAESALEGRQPWRYFCPIWQNAADPEAAGQPWWMTFNRETYANDVLRLMGGQNVFSDRQRLYPLQADLGLVEPQEAGGRDTRYPRLTIEEIRAAQPEVILLPSEPFAFDESQVQALSQLLADTPAVRNAQVHLCDGSLITWHGTRLARALRDLPTLFPDSPSASKI